MNLPAALHVRAAAETAWRISPADSNYFILLFDPETEGYQSVAVIEVFEHGGATPPNSHKYAHEFFYVLHGQGRASADGKTIAIAKGDALLLRPGSEHIIENTGPGKLYTLTIMTPNEGFAELIRSGTQIPLDGKDRLVLGEIDEQPRHKFL
jgi:mannose-6-phosphate isomerase-like protein (cupin superfamily)